MTYKQTIPRRIFLVLNTCLCGLIALACLLPLWHVLMYSLSDPGRAMTSTLVLYPLGGLDTTAYSIILGYDKIWQGYGNTILYVVGSCAVTVVMTVIGGYVFSRRTFKYRNRFLMILTFGMMFNGGTIPTYIVIKSVGLIDTIWANIIPGALTIFNIAMVKTAMEQIPISLDESAKLDGASEITCMFRIYLPLIKSTIAVIVLFAAIMKWNDYYSSLLYLPTAKNLYPLQMVLREIMLDSSTASEAMGASQYSQYYQGIQYAAIMVASLPILCIYPFVQRFFVTGITLGAVKE